MNFSFKPLDCCERFSVHNQFRTSKVFHLVQDLTSDIIFIRFLPKLAGASLDKALEDAQITVKNLDEAIDREYEEKAMPSYTCE